MKKLKICLITSALVMGTSLVMTSCTNKEDLVTLNPVQTESAQEDDKASETKDENSKEKEDDTKTPTADKTEQSDKTAKEANEDKNSNEDNENKDSSDDKVNDSFTTNIPYPTFDNFDKANEIVLDYVKKLDKTYNSDDTTLDINFKITQQNDKIISIHYFGDVKSSTAAYPSKFESTLNISAKQATVKKLSEMVDLTEKTLDNFSKELGMKFKALGVPVPDNLKGNNLKAVLNNADSNGEYLSEAQSYLSDDGIFVILSVPHALGDYIEIKII
ncbi:MAG: hypothetical protein ACRC6T_08350 [Sarcina sp.]